MKIVLIAYFFAGIFFANAIPHYVNGICGNRFPKRFPFRKSGKPAGRFEKTFGSSVGNVVWGMINFLITFLLLYFNKFITGINTDTFVFLAGFVVSSVFLAWNFGRVQSETD
jgi:hypothetical protein